MILEFVPEAPTKGMAGGVPSRQYFTETSSLFTLSLDLSIKHNSSATRIQFKKYFFVTSPVLHHFFLIELLIIYQVIIYPILLNILASIYFFMLVMQL